MTENEAGHERLGAGANGGFVLAAFITGITIAVPLGIKIANDIAAR